MGEQCFSQKTYVIKWKSLYILMIYWLGSSQKHPKPQKLLPLFLVNYHNDMARPYCWRCIMLPLQDKEKSILNWPGISLLDSFDCAGRCCTGCWKRKDINCLIQHWTLHSILWIPQARCGHWCNNNMNVMGKTNHSWFDIKIFYQHSVHSILN